MMKARLAVVAMSCVFVQIFLAAALPARYPALYNADRLPYDQSSTFGQLLWLICF
jgi:hypothetical protein